MIFLPFIFLLIISLILIVFLIYKNKTLSRTVSTLEQQKQQPLEIQNTINLLPEEKEKFASEKKKLEEKNRKLFQMSETVYKEKKKVDEMNELLRTEKEKLEIDKNKVNEKIKKLWQQGIAIHKEREKVEIIKAEIELKHREVTDSITYAKRIQTAILPLEHEIYSVLPDSFVLYMPKNIVSGDFYWFTVKNEKIFLAVVDCTGHGVPGAFMSMVGHTLLNEIVLQHGFTDPGIILNELNNNVRFILKQDNSETSTRDGMDICLCVFDKEKHSLQYAGANRPLWIIKNGLALGEIELTEIKATKEAIGGIHEKAVSFQTHNLTVDIGDCFYLSSDGYADQFSHKDKKMMIKKFKETLLEIQNKTMQEQGKYLEEFHNNWKGSTEQTDDVLVIGIKFNQLNIILKNTPNRP